VNLISLASYQKTLIKMFLMFCFIRRINCIIKKTWFLTIISYFTLYNSVLHTENCVWQTIYFYHFYCLQWFLVAFVKQKDRMTILRKRRFCKFIKSCVHILFSLSRNVGIAWSKKKIKSHLISLSKIKSLYQKPPKRAKLLIDQS